MSLTVLLGFMGLLLCETGEAGKSCFLDGLVEDVVTSAVSEAASIINLQGSCAYSQCKPKDCGDHFRNGEIKNGVYKIRPEGWNGCEFKVFCDMESQGGGWTVIQKRGDYGKPKDYFFKRWRDYKFGFGNLLSDFWLGNDKIHYITKQDNYELRVELTTNEQESRHAQYEEFFLEDENNFYKLNVYGFSGNAGDSLSAHSGHKFSTKDKDSDSDPRNCAEIYKGAWWYNKCHVSNLNGLYYNGYHSSFADGINWLSWKGYNFSYTESQMKIRLKSTTLI